MPALHVQSLSLFPDGVGADHLLRDVSLEVEEGSCVGILGANGAGKSTFFRLVLGLTPIGAGRAELLGESVPTRASRVGVAYLPEQIWQPPYLTGREYLRFFGQLEGLTAAGAAVACERELERVGLLAAGDQQTRTYSKGMQQKLEVARVFLVEKRLLILDEPLTGLDLESQVALEQRLLAERERGVTILLAAHEPHLLERLCDHLAILRGGRLVRHGRSEEVLGERGWYLDLEDPARLPDPVPAGAEVLTESSRLIFEKRSQAEEALAELAARGAGVLAFGALRGSVETLMLEEGNR